MAAEKKDEKSDKGLESYITPPTPKKSDADSGAKDKGIFSGLRVSLMPEELQGTATANLRRRLIILGLVLVVESIILGTVYFFIKSYTDKQADKLDSLVLQIRSVQKEGMTLEDKVKDTASFGPQLVSSRASLDERLAWTPFFKFLETVTLPTVNYMSFNANYGSKMVSLTCMADSYRDAAEQIVLFRQSEKIKEANVASVGAVINDAGEIMGINFSVSLLVSDDMWNAAQLYEGGAVSPVGFGEDEERTGAIAIPSRTGDEANGSAADGQTEPAAGDAITE